MNENIYMTMNQDHGLLGWSRKHLSLMLVVGLIGAMIAGSLGLIRHEVTYDLTSYESNQDFNQLAQQRALLQTLQNRQQNTGDSAVADGSRSSVGDPFSYTANNTAESAASTGVADGSDMGGDTEQGSAQVSLTDEQNALLAASKLSGVTADMSDDELSALIPKSKVVVEPVIKGQNRWMLFFFAPIALVAIMTNRFLGAGSTLLSEMLRISRFHNGQRTYLYVHRISMNRGEDEQESI